MILDINFSAIRINSFDDDGDLKYGDVGDLSSVGYTLWWWW